MLAPVMFFREADAAEKTALGTSDRENGRAVTLNQLNAFLAHPVGHVYKNRVAHGGAYSGQRDTRVAAGRLDDGIAGLQIIRGIS
jgi:hypothetical protein